MTILSKVKRFLTTKPKVFSWDVIYRWAMKTVNCFTCFTLKSNCVDYRCVHWCNFIVPITFHKNYKDTFEESIQYVIITQLSKKSWLYLMWLKAPMVFSISDCCIMKRLFEINVLIVDIYWLEYKQLMFTYILKQKWLTSFAWNARLLPCNSIHHT